MMDKNVFAVDTDDADFGSFHLLGISIGSDRTLGLINGKKWMRIRTDLFICENRATICGSRSYRLPSTFLMIWIFRPPHQRRVIQYLSFSATP